ncbi:MAG: hypothetical protein O3B04_09645 [Chloroflexi bacterium]|nr:hypothetical protein [Chloroflexota bacterium]
MTVHIQSLEGPIFGDSDELSIATGGDAVSVASLLAWDGTNLVLADADAIATYAQFIALRAGKGATADPNHGSNRIAVARRVRLYDDAAGFTANTPIYLSGTAGGYTQTRPTGAADVRQVVGWAFTTSYAEINIKAPTEIDVVGKEALLVASAARLILDTGPAGGIVLAAASDSVSYSVRIPENAVGIAAANLLWSANITLDASDTYTVTVSSGIEDGAHDVVTDSIAAAALTVTADEIARADISAGLNAASLVKPGGIIFIKILKAAEGTGGDDPVVFPPVVTFTVV